MKEKLQRVGPQTFQDPPHQLNQSHVTRRARAYLQGYFLQLRMATLQGFGTELFCETIMKAKELCEMTFFNDPRRTSMMKTIEWDLKNIDKILFLKILIIIRNNLIWNANLVEQILSIDRVSTVQKIPGFLRQKFAEAFNSILSNILHSNTVAHHAELLVFAKVTLHLKTFPTSLKRKKRTNLQNKQLLSNIDSWNAGGESRDQLVDELLFHTPPNNQPYTNATRKAKQKRCKHLVCERGEFSNAIKALHSDGIAAPSHQVFQQLLEKHPDGPDMDYLSLPIDLEQPAAISEEELCASLSSFKKSSAPGRSGLRADHLMQLLAVPIPDLKANVAKVMTIYIQGKAPAALAPLFASAPLIPLMKKDDSIRPIAIGETLRRLGSKILFRRSLNKATAHLSPFQLGVGISNGIEAIIHGLNRLLNDDHLPREAVFLMIDFSNAFNNISRQSILDNLAEHFPSLIPWYKYTYGYQPVLFVGDDHFYSRAGVQQGDPHSPFLFALALQPLLKHLHDEFACSVCAYLDDVTIFLPTYQPQ